MIRPDTARDTTMPKLKNVTLAALGITLCLSLSACGGSTKDEDAPIGIGTGPNSLKKSPCACNTLKNSAADMLKKSSLYTLNA